MQPPLNGVILWAQNEIDKLEPALPFDDGWWICSALKENQPGDRLLIYATRADQGIVAIFDVATSAFEHRALGKYAVYGRPKVLPEPIPASVLPPTMVGKQGRYQLSNDERKVLPAVVPVIPWQDCEDELPEPGDPNWDVRLQERVWGSEVGLSDVIADELNAYSQVGYIDPPRREERPAKHSKRRMDLFGKDRHGRELVTEIKHFCGTQALAQLDDYLNTRRAAARRCAATWLHSAATHVPLPWRSRTGPTSPSGDAGRTALAIPSSSTLPGHESHDRSNGGPLPRDEVADALKNRRETAPLEPICGSGAGHRRRCRSNEAQDGHACSCPEHQPHHWRASGNAASTRQEWRAPSQERVSRGSVRSAPQLATCGAQRDLCSPVADDGRREVPRFLQSRARHTEPRKIRERVCAPFAGQTCVARHGGLPRRLGGAGIAPGARWPARRA
jgi:hypothetical protein